MRMSVVQGAPRTGPLGIPSIRVSPLSTLVTDTALLPATDPAVSPVLAAPAAGYSYFVVLANSSTAAQQIRVGLAPTFVGATSGYLLTPGDTITLPNINFALNACCDIAGGRLERFITRG